MHQSLVEAPQSTQYGGGNEATHLRVKRLQGKIDEMEVRSAQAGGLSEANLNHYNFIKKHKEFEEQKLRTGDDIHLVIRPIGALRSPTDVVQARIVCVLPENAAEIMAFAAKHSQAVRLATPDEIKAYKEYNEELRRIHQGRFAAEQQRLTQLQLQQVLGQAATAMVMPALPQEELPPEPTAPLAMPKPSDGLEQPVSPQGGPAQPPAETTKPQPGDAERAGGFESKMLELGNEKQTSLLINAGYFRVDQVAEASPEDLTKIKGIGAKTAAQILVRANQIRAEPEEPAEDAKE